MNQQKIGDFLKHLRKDKGLTQEQLAEKFNVSSRTVSRWETGRNLPDVEMLIALADFYDVDIRQILDGERQREQKDHDGTDTFKKVAAYTAQKEKGMQSKAVCAALAMAVSLLVCTKLFAGETKGLLYGIVSERICDGIMVFIYGIAGALLIAYLKAYWWQEKASDEPERSVMASVVSKTVKPGTHGAGRSKGGYSYVVTFLSADGQRLELYTYELEFGGLKEGMNGCLTYKGRYFVGFEDTGTRH